MSDKIFEERVSAELKNFGLKPDAAVWAGVEASLEPKRKKRGIVWFLLFGILAGVGFWVYQISNHSAESMRYPIVVKSIPKVGASKMDKFEGKENDKVIEVGDDADHKLKIIEQHITQIRQFSIKPAFKKSVIDEKASTSTPIILENISANKKSVEATQSLQPEMVLVQLKEDKNDSIPALLKGSLPIFDRADTDSSSGKKVEKSTHKWKWSIAATAGISVLRSGLFTGDKSYNIAEYANNFSNQVTAVSFSKPNISNAASYDFSVQSERMLNKRTGLQFALGYTLYRNNILVGTKVATTSSTTLRFLADNTEKVAQDNFYYSNGQQNEYTNQYHFLHFTTSVFKSARLNKSISIRMNIGLMGSYLFASNGLHYITGKDVLVKNNSLLNKWQTGVIGSVEMGIGKKPWLFLGPEFRYQFTNLSVLSGTSQHLGLAGMRLRINLPEKIKSLQR